MRLPSLRSSVLPTHTSGPEAELPCGGGSKVSNPLGSLERSPLASWYALNAPGTTLAITGLNKRDGDDFSGTGPDPVGIGVICIGRGEEGNKPSPLLELRLEWKAVFGWGGLDVEWKAGSQARCGGINGREQEAEGGQTPRYHPTFHAAGTGGTAREEMRWV